GLHITVVRFRQARLRPDDVAQQRFALNVAVSSEPERFAVCGLQRLRELDLFSCLGNPTILVRDVHHDARLGVAQLERGLRLGRLLLLNLFSFPSPVEDVPVDLNADTAHAVRKDAAVVDRPKRGEREADVRDPLRTRSPPFELRLSLLHFRQPDLGPRRERLGVRVVQRERVRIGDAGRVDFERGIDWSTHQPIELLFLRRDRVLGPEQLVFGLNELRLDVQLVVTQRGALEHLLAGLAFELLQEIDRLRERLSTALSLRDAVVEVTHFVDDRLPLRAQLFLAGLDADSREIDPEPDLDLLRERLRHGRVTDKAELQRALQGRR